jgi:hypothetical protein
MSFGTSETLTLNAVAYVLYKITQDNYGSEYQWRDPAGGSIIIMKIRHSKETVKAGTRPMDRHNVEIQWTIAATATALEINRYASFTFRMPAADSVTTAGYLFKAATDYLGVTTRQTDLLTWQN